MQQNDERAFPLVDVVHADTVYVGETVVERSRFVGIHFPKRRSRLISVQRSAWVHFQLVLHVHKPQG